MTAHAVRRVVVCGVLKTKELGYPYEGLGSLGGFSLNILKNEASC